jgi:hypothetical protein
MSAKAAYRSAASRSADSSAAGMRSAGRAPREVLEQLGNGQPERLSAHSAGAVEHPYPKRRRSQKLRVPAYAPNHGEPFADATEYSHATWAAIYAFMGSRRQLSMPDLSDRVREQLTAELPGVIAELDAARVDPYYANRAHTVIPTREQRKRRPPTPATIAPADALGDLEAALRASIEQAGA